ncbi:MAG: hypothetical protein ABIA93_03875, partial [Candidatus Woesearchaeota archaeon]
VLVSTLDFTSMYPSVTTLMGLWQYIIADQITFEDDTANVQKLIDNITPGQLMNKEIWQDLNVLVEIYPQDNILPSRLNYSQFSHQSKHQKRRSTSHQSSHQESMQDSYTIGLNHLTYNQESLYYPLCDVLAARILDKKPVRIKKATRFLASKPQKDLKKTNILGMTIDPYKANFVRELVEKRQKTKKAIPLAPLTEKRHLMAVQKALKILANSTTYGIFVELNPDDKVEDQDIYSNTQFFTSENKNEALGEYFNPLIAVMLVAGARLLLALAEEYATSRGKYYTYMDTDSISVPPNIASDLSEYFQRLNPYKTNTAFLKIEKENRLFYGISSKRYCLYTIKKGQIHIEEDLKEREYKLHGLGHLLSPFTKKDWHRDLWLDILQHHYNKISERQLRDKYRKFYALTQLTITTPYIMKKFEKLNKTQSIHKQIKPFNFILVGVGNKEGVKPLAPYNKNSQTIAHEPFIDYKTGRTLYGIEYWQPLSTLLDNYINHPEDKLQGTTGTLERRHITPNNIVHIGKETNKIQEQPLGKKQLTTYSDPEKLKQRILALSPKERRKLGISRQRYAYWKKTIINLEQIKLRKCTQTILNMTSK